mmetsp:Transcript_3361/g.20976  ORF Transcript_3361/g.20976 Transcript_3361/m.20976 type:complete len:218 (+) Transcript_3361:3761-4414(+)
MHRICLDCESIVVSTCIPCQFQIHGLTLRVGSIIEFPIAHQTSLACDIMAISHMLLNLLLSSLYGPETDLIHQAVECLRGLGATTVAVLLASNQERPSIRQGVGACGLHVGDEETVEIYPGGTIGFCIPRDRNVMPGSLPVHEVSQVVAIEGFASLVVIGRSLVVIWHQHEIIEVMASNESIHIPGHKRVVSPLSLHIVSRMGFHRIAEERPGIAVV